MNWRWKILTKPRMWVDYDQGIVTYEPKKLGLSAHYNKRYVLTDVIHARP